MHYFKHSRNELFQDFCLSRDYFICNLLRQWQNSLHPIAKTRGHLVILVLFLQELSRQALLLPPKCKGRTLTSNVTWVTPIATFAIEFNYQVSIYCSFHVDGGEPTSAKTEPYLITLSTVFSVDALINGVYSFSNSSSSWSDERRASAYADFIR